MRGRGRECGVRGCVKWDARTDPVGNEAAE
jgi:hypothetical protein